MGEGDWPFVPGGEQAGLKKKIKQGGGFYGGPDFMGGGGAGPASVTPLSELGDLFSMGGMEGGTVSAPIGPQQGALNDLFMTLLGGAGAGSSPLAGLLWGHASGEGAPNPLMDFFMSALFGGGAAGQGGTSTGSPAKDRALGVTGAAGGAGASPLAGSLFNLASGILPPEIASRINAQVAESYRGARFGTDEAGAAAGAMSRAALEQQLNAMNQLFGIGRAGTQAQLGGREQQLSAIGQILGLGRFTGGLEFQGGQNDLNRALEEFLGTQNPLLALLPYLLQQGAAG
jgi:hypothetical protein